MTQNPTYLINGSFDQSISPFDRGFAYGDGIFRTLIVKAGQPAHWAMHYQKLVEDCAAIGIVCPRAELLIEDIKLLFVPDFGEVAVAKIVITRGEGERGYAIPSIVTPTRVVIKYSLPSYADTFYVEGVSLHLCETRLSAQPKLAGIKHLNRLENVMARSEWQDEMLFDGLLLDDQDHVIECTMGNIFARFGDELLTPDLSLCGVAGITRQRILHLAKSLNLMTRVQPLPFTHLLKADEVLICNSVYGVFQVTRILDKTWTPQPLANQIRNLLVHD